LVVVSEPPETATANHHVLEPEFTWSFTLLLLDDAEVVGEGVGADVAAEVGATVAGVEAEEVGEAVAELVGEAVAELVGEEVEVEVESPDS
jgi:hypothetical protein